jgi:adenylate kinase
MLAKFNRRINAVVLMTADDEVLTERITSRRVCPECGASYNINTKKPKVDGICDVCGHELIQRKDDNAEAFKVRLDAYAKQTFPIAEHYAKQNVLGKVDALQSIEEVFADIKKILLEAK